MRTRPLRGQALRSSRSDCLSTSCRLTRQQISSSLVKLGFSALQDGTFVRGALRVTLLDVPRIAIYGAHGVLYVALLSPGHLSEQVALLQPAVACALAATDPPWKEASCKH